MKAYYVVGISFCDCAPDKQFSVYCRCPQEAIDMVCAGLYDNGYYYHKDYFIEFCAVKCMYEWTVQKKFRGYNLPEIDDFD